MKINIKYKRKQINKYARLFSYYFGTLKKTVRPRIIVITMRNGTQVRRKPAKLKQIIKKRRNDM
jgi:hypothetical protein